MFYVYLLQSLTLPNQRHTGYTTDMESRLQKHNEGGSPHTAKYRPWKIVAYFAFEDEQTAAQFELYLKSGSGRAFANKHFWKQGQP